MNTIGWNFAFFYSHFWRWELLPKCLWTKVKIFALGSYADVLDHCGPAPLPRLNIYYSHILQNSLTLSTKIILWQKNYRTMSEVWQKYERKMREQWHSNDRTTTGKLQKNDIIMAEQWKNNNWTKKRMKTEQWQEKNTRTMTEKWLCLVWQNKDNSMTDQWQNNDITKTEQ